MLSDGLVPSLFSQISSMSGLSPGVSNTDNTARSCERVAFEGADDDDDASPEDLTFTEVYFRKRSRLSNRVHT